ncbi:MAG: response regulator [Thermodesulfobacteriota bacterium]
MEHTYRILLVDDEPDFLEMMTKRLGRRGFQSKTATTCAAGFTIVESGWPQLVVLDVMLPDQDGIECLKRIKGHNPRLPVVMLTGHASMQAGLKGMEYGANDYCLKPIELDELVEKLLIALREAGG